MNKRRNIILALGASALIVPFGSFAQQSGKLVRVAIFERTSAEKYRALEKIFVDTLSELGWVEGRNIVYDRVYADDDVRRIPALAAALVKRNPDLIYTITFEPAREAFAATRTIPIVNGSESRWIKDGWAKTLAHPGGNMTGIANIGNELGAKRLQLLVERAHRP